MNSPALRRFGLIVLLFPFTWDLILGFTCDSGDTYATENLKIHNLFRERHNSQFVANLILNDELCEMAMTWAKSIGEDADKNGVATALKRPSSDNDNPRYGDNIGGLDARVVKEYKGIEDIGGYAVRQWYYEILRHNFKKGSNFFYKETSHFTQLIWVDSKELGVAHIVTPKGHLIVVCIYRPAGNLGYHEAFERNVREPHLVPGEYWDEWMNKPDFVKDFH